MNVRSNRLLRSLLLLMGVLICSAAIAGGNHLRVTGTYELNQGNSENTLYVKELGGKKIKFAMQSLRIRDKIHEYANNGQAAGVAERTGNIATYKQDVLQLTFKFTPGKCKVECPQPNWYGGMGVDPNGVYKRTNAAVPSEKELTPL